MVKITAAKTPTVSIVSPNYNGKEYLRDFLESLHWQTYKDFEIIIVDNASKDDSVGFIRKNYPNIKLIQSKINLGFSGGCNLGVKHSSGRYIVLLDNDVKLKKDWLDKMVNMLTKNPKTGCAGTPSVDFDLFDSGKPYKKPTTINLLGYHIHFQLPPKEEQKLYEDLVFFAGGGTLIYRKELSPVPYDDKYFGFMEDLDLCWRLRLQGYQIKLVPNSFTYHHGDSVFKKMKFRAKMHGEKNRLIDLFTLYEFTTLVKITPLLLVGLIFHNLMDIKGIPARAAAYLWLIAHIPYIIRKRKVNNQIRKVKDSKIISRMSSKLYDELKISNPLLRSILKSINSVTFHYCSLLNLKTFDLYGRQQWH